MDHARLVYNPANEVAEYYFFAIHIPAVYLQYLPQAEGCGLYF